MKWWKGATWYDWNRNIKNELIKLKKQKILSYKKKLIIQKNQCEVDKKIEIPESQKTKN